MDRLRGAGGVLRKKLMSTARRQVYAPPLPAEDDTRRFETTASPSRRTWEPTWGSFCSRLRGPCAQFLFSAEPILHVMPVLAAAFRPVPVREACNLIVRKRLGSEGARSVRFHRQNGRLLGWGLPWFRRTFAFLNVACHVGYPPGRFQAFRGLFVPLSGVGSQRVRRKIYSVGSGNQQPRNAAGR